MVALGIALLGIACASILLVIAEKEISPYAATFDRLSIATVIFGVWVIGQSVLSPKPPLTALDSSVVFPDKAEGRDVRDGAELSDSSAVSNGLFNGLMASRLLTVAVFVIAGLSFAGSLSLWAWSLTQTSVANSTLLNNMMPIFTTLGAWLVYRQTFTRQFLVGMGVAIAGAIIIGLADLQLTDGLVGDEAALVASMLSAVSILSIERLRTQFSTPYIMMWTSLVGSLFLGVLLWGLHDSFFPHTVNAWAAVISLAVLSQALGQGLLTYSLKQFSASLVAVSMLSIPVIAAFLAVMLFTERLSVLNWMAFAVVLVGIYLSVSSKFSSEIQDTA